MPITERNLKIGTRLTARYKKKVYAAEVIGGKDGKVRYRLADGREFASPSAAGKAVMGGVACNGWRFWSVANGAAPADAPRAHTAANSAPQAGRSPTTAALAPAANRAPTGATNGNGKSASKPTAKPATTGKAKAPKAARKPAKRTATARKR